MPQLIAMIIVVVGALIYMFQTFGGTGDKIEGIAQKPSILTEIANVKNGVQLALRSNDIQAGATTLKTLATSQYFAQQMNEEITDTGVYNAISFGGNDNSSMAITLIVPAAGSTSRPGLKIVLSNALEQNKNFLESQIKKDLEAVADFKTDADTPVDDTTDDGTFVIYYKDLPTGLIQAAATN